LQNINPDETKKILQYQKYFIGTKDAYHVPEIRAIEEVYEDMGFESDLEVIRSVH
jgi:hypothetical protein